MDIRLENVKKNYNTMGQNRETTEVLKGVSFSISQGEYISIIGRSGCGKTTLLRIVGLLDQPSEGDIYIDDVKQKDLWKDELADIRRRKMGFVFQDFLLLENLSALDNIIMPGLLEKMDGKKATERAYELADYLQIPQTLLKKYPNQLSGGEKQRMAIARALFNDPEMILADEPTGNLDEKNRQMVEDIFDKLHNGMNKTILLVTHDLEFADRSQVKYQIQEGVISNVRG